MLRIIFQVLGILLLLPAVTIATLRIVNADADGPSILFPGGKLVSGTLHDGAEPDWSFTDDIFTIELQLEEPLSSRKIFVMESAGKVYIPSGYMRSTLGRIWKEWALEAAEGDGLAVARIDGTRYERRLIRITDPDIIDGVARKMAIKYAGGEKPETIAAMSQSVADGDTWIFEMAPRGDAS